MKLLKFLDERLEEMICVFVLAAMTLVIFIQIIIRAISVYVTIPMAWTEEIGRYLAAGHTRRWTSSPSSAATPES